MVKKMIYFLLIDPTSIKVWNSLQEILNLLKVTFYLYCFFCVWKVHSYSLINHSNYTVIMEFSLTKNVQGFSLGTDQSFSFMYRIFPFSLILDNWTKKDCWNCYKWTVINEFLQSDITDRSDRHLYIFMINTMAQSTLNNKKYEFHMSQPLCLSY